MACVGAALFDVEGGGGPPPVGNTALFAVGILD